MDLYKVGVPIFVAVMSAIAFLIEFFHSFQGMRKG